MQYACIVVERYRCFFTAWTHQRRRLHQVNTGTTSISSQQHQHASFSTRYPSSESPPATTTTTESVNSTSTMYFIAS